MFRVQARRISRTIKHACWSEAVEQNTEAPEARISASAGSSWWRAAAVAADFDLAGEVFRRRFLFSRFRLNTHTSAGESAAIAIRGALVPCEEQLQYKHGGQSGTGSSFFAFFAEVVSELEASKLEDRKSLYSGGSKRRHVLGQVRSSAWWILFQGKQSRTRCV